MSCQFNVMKFSGLVVRYKRFTLKYMHSILGDRSKKGWKINKNINKKKYCRSNDKGILLKARTDRLST